MAARALDMPENRAKQDSPHMFPELPGIKVDSKLSRALRVEVSLLLERHNTSFPGAQPISFARRHISQELLKRDYFVAEKSDGIRCLLWCTSDREGRELHYLIDRRNDYYLIDHLHMPSEKNDPNLFLNQTIFDGELVLDRIEGGSYRLKFLIFDSLVRQGECIANRTLDKRLAYIKSLLGPLRDYYKTNPEKEKEAPFSIDDKPVCLSYAIEDMFRIILPNLPHGNDGLIFTCRETPYHYGTDMHILKWKPPLDNSIDFLLSLEFANVMPDEQDRANGMTEPFPDYSIMPTFGLYVMHDKKDFRRYATMYMEPDEWESLKQKNEPLDEAVVECYKDDNNRWRFLRIRKDKDYPNHISVVESVKESIDDKVSMEELMLSARQIKLSWKARNQAGYQIENHRDHNRDRRELGRIGRN